ncbi:MAG: hypothetical protein F6J95_007350 [Leptolyngbya sp. SIO1E4]|nr:hypothetical protein [Leptolyngbya sp. SIO1E4]
MDLTRLLIQVLVALACAGTAAFLLPRKVPGRLFGLALMGLAGVWLGQWIVSLLHTTYDVPIPDFVTWAIEGVPIVPAIVGSAIILYTVTTLLSWGRYQR